MARLPNDMGEIHSIGPETRERILGSHGVPMLATFGIRLIGISDAEAGFAWARGDPADNQILATLSGEGEVWHREQWEPLRPGYAYVTPSQIPHAYRAKPGTPWSVGWVIYEKTAPALAEFLPPVPSVIALPEAQLRHAMEGAWDASVRHLSPSLLELWVQLIHHIVLHSLHAIQRVEPRLAPLWSTVSAELARPWTLDELARRAAMSKESLRRVCLKETGTSPLHYLTRLRMRRATELLLFSGDKMLSIAERVGYRDPFAFSIAFKRETGLAPSDYRKAKAK